MAKGLFLTFLALSVGGLAFADYTNQTMRMGAKLGDIGPGEYFNTFTARYKGMQDGWQADALAADLRSKDLRELLPAGDNGWTMREWNEADRALLFPSADAPEVPPELQAVLDENVLFSGLQAAGEREARIKEQVSTRFYQRGDSLIALQLDYQPPRGNDGGIAGLGMNIIEGNMAAMSGNQGFAVIQGVTYGQSTGLFGVGGDSDGPRIIKGRMGDEVRITVRARASDEEIYALLSSIDYDTLNLMMVRPLGNVGSAAADIPLDRQRAIADAAIADQVQALVDRGRESEAAIMALGGAVAASGGAAELEPSSSGLGGIFGMSTAPATDPDSAPAQVRRIGAAEDCVMIGARKSCGVQAD